MPASTPPTYYQDVAPIFQQQCQVCHQKGGLAEFLPLSSYEAIKPYAQFLKFTVQSRRMPPFSADNSGQCQTYENARWLSDKQIETISLWAENGAIEGEFVEIPLPPISKELAGQTHETQMPEPYLPDINLHDDYRCFLMEPGFEGDHPKFLKDYLVVPGNDQAVHHVVGYQVESEAAAAQARRKDAEEDGPGYSCFGGAGVSAVRMIMNWAPGTGTITHPENTGIRLDPSLPIILQVHYHISSPDIKTDQTKIKMKLAEDVEREIIPTFLTPLKPLIIPPQTKEYVHEGDISLQGVYGQGVPIQILGVRAHMHKLGSKMKISIQTNDRNQCLVDIPRYYFNWQTSYFLSEPVNAMSDDDIRISCIYNSLGKDTTTTWGNGTEDEMCLATVYTVRRD